MVPKTATSNTSGLGGIAGFNKLNPFLPPADTTGRSTPGAGGGLGGAYDPAAPPPDPYANPPGAGFTPPPTITINSGGAAPYQGSSDWASQILNDPAFMNLKNLLSAQGISDASHLRGAIQQALIGFGAVPDLPSDVLSTTGLDTAATAELAKNNPFSVLARLGQAYQDQQSAAKNNLAARGILNSGETGYQLGRIGQQNALGQYNATSSLLGNIGSLNDAYTAGRQAAAQQLANGALTSESNLAASGALAPPAAAGMAPAAAAPAGGSTAGGGTTVTATWNPGTATYVDPAGNHYAQDGTPVTAPPSVTPPPSAPPSVTPPPSAPSVTPPPPAPSVTPPQPVTAPVNLAGPQSPGRGGLRVLPF